MELTPTCSSLLARFSNAINILKFFGHVDQCRLLMKSLCSQTRATWNLHEEAFASHIEAVCKTIQYDSWFDPAFAAFLIEDNRYERYKL